jgi:D-galactose 1-dehydrogenase
VRAGAITWREDIRRWHPGQDWILDVGGMGVFDPGINALSILTDILPVDITLQSADLSTPSNRQAPIAATLKLRTSDGAAIAADFDFLQQGKQIWTIHLETNDGVLDLAHGGASLSIDGKAHSMPPPDAHAEYKGVYAHFAERIRVRQTDMDLRPLELVADAFMLAKRATESPFDF